MAQNPRQFPTSDPQPPHPQPAAAGKEKKRNLLLGAISALILLYFHPALFWSYLLILVVLSGICFLFFSTPRVKIGKFIANSTTVVVSFFILALLLELGLHLKPHFFMASRNPDILGEFSDFTSRGFLSEKVFQKEKGAFRILGLGDSFAVCFPNNIKKHNYHAFLQQKFRELGGRKVEIVNAGMMCVGPGYYWHILEKYGDRFQPDLVLVGFFVGNDFLEYDFFINLGDLISEPRDLRKKIRDYRSFKGFRLYKLVHHRYIQYREQRRLAREMKETSGQGRGTFSEESFLEVEKSRSVFFRKDHQADLDRLWRQCSPVFARIKQWCDARNIPLVLAIFPDQFQVDKNLREKLFRKYQLSEDSLDLDYPDRLLRDFCRANNIYCLDLLGPFQQASQTTSLYLLWDSHWNAAGNRLAADQIFQFLREHKLIKPE